uniref:Uncharacterized protein n=1 Tax=Panagrolaimus sp. ES5 TaxID=591445 RepID=A0AC34FS25_9BILA
MEQSSAAAVTEVNQNVIDSKASKESAVKLKPRISLFNGCALIVGCVIGSGIFVSPQEIVKNTGSPLLSIVLWAFCGVYALLGALCYAELGTTIPKSGGDYNYVYEAFGALPAFLILWATTLLIIPPILAIISLTGGRYAITFFYENGVVPTAPIKLLAACFLMFFAFINCYKLKWITRIQNVAMVAKVLALTIIFIVGIVYVCRGNTETMTWESLTANTKWSPSAIPMAFYAGVFSYTGWYFLNFVAEELKEPNKNLPKAIYISLPIITVIYILVNLGYFCVLSAPEMIASKAVGIDFASKAMGPVSFLLPVFVVGACLGSLNGVTFAFSRIFFAAARNGHFPEIFGMINVKNCIPIPSVILLCTTALITLVVDDMSLLLNWFAFTQSVVTTIVIAGFLKMRIWEMRKKTPPRTPAIRFHISLPIIFFIACLYIDIVPLYQEFLNILPALGINLAGIPAYFLFIYWKNKPAWLMRPWVYFTHGVQIILLCVSDESNSF